LSNSSLFMSILATCGSCDEDFSKVHEVDA
jgi:hypothetical protein